MSVFFLDKPAAFINVSDAVVVKNAPVAIVTVMNVPVAVVTVMDIPLQLSL